MEDNKMREIKFRAWLPKSKVMLYKGSLMDLWGYSWLYDGGLANAIPMQYTGLKDKNGEEIYEGDILGGVWEQCYIAWCDKCKSFQVFIVGLSSPKYCMACNGDVHWAEIVEDDGKLEVIGNIYENPELLKQPSISPKE